MVAIDTVATVLAGYDPKSIELLETASRNNLGTDNPAYINLKGLYNFGFHREELYNLYGSQGRYPFENGWGGARVLEHIKYSWIIKLDKPVLVSEGIYSFKYRLEIQAEPPPELVRAELWINGSIKDFRTQGLLDHGQFEVNVADELQKYGALNYMLYIWDRTFNCFFSGEHSFLP